MRKLTVATKNRKKKEELVELLKGLKVRVLTLQDIDTEVPRVIEDGRHACEQQISAHYRETVKSLLES